MTFLSSLEVEQVGWEFARFCRHADDTLFQVIGTIEFTNNYVAIFKFLNGLNLVA